ncbi:hypothetical protein B0H15DRAFT_914123 [Mycena belliarum]|uniref:Uncharacterized protein n=1 Tax=Mycena belliarum TaxID=1033014 RepID=A0AAD6TTU6_9AGAR|nr:hypothetical protein B0H15DRAFT_914123 [Mycena belliae]
MLLENVLYVVPAALKYFVVLLFLLNAGSWPLIWHLRVFSCIIEEMLARRLVQLRHVFSGRQVRATALEAHFDARMPVGVHPFRRVWTYSDWVRLDDSDFNLHMSNSSYAKALDSARFRLALATFPNILRCGGRIALAGTSPHPLLYREGFTSLYLPATHYHFIREIPMLSRYEMRTSIGAWDEKWIWVITRFVKPHSKTSATASTSGKSQSKTPPDPLFPALATPATPLSSGTSTPSGIAGPDAISQALLARAVRDAAREPDGALLYTTVVSQLCFKAGRLTVPPALVLAANGFYVPPPITSTSSSSASPRASPSSQTHPAPPHWPRTAALRASPRALHAFFAGGWRAAPDGERWWEGALAGCEVERRARVVPFVGTGDSGIKGGMEGVRALV